MLAIDGDIERVGRYQAFFACLVAGDCSDLRRYQDKLERQIKPTDHTTINGHKPNLSCAWTSDFGKINWDQGYYGSTLKTIQGTLKLDDGYYVYDGTWGRTNSERKGTVYFVFSSDGRSFDGYYTHEGSTQTYDWGGSGSCSK